MMKSPVMALLAIISFLHFAGHSSCSGRLLEKNLFIASDDPSTFDPNPKSFLDDGSSLQKEAVVHSDEEISPLSSSSEKNALKDEDKLSFEVSLTNVQTKSKANESPALNKAERVFHLLSKGKVTLPGFGPKVNAIMTEQRLSKSKRSPGVGHMQIIRPQSHTMNGYIMKSHHRNGDAKKDKRKLLSTSSTGAGH